MSYKEGILLKYQFQKLILKSLQVIRQIFILKLHFKNFLYKIIAIVEKFKTFRKGIESLILSFNRPNAICFYNL